MRYLVIDGELNGTGIRDKYEGGYLHPEDLGLSGKVMDQLKTWLARYENEHYYGFKDHTILDELDKEGKEIAVWIKEELGDIKVEYYSAGRLNLEIIYGK